MILVTGPTGLLGSRLLFDLAAAGKKVRALKRTNSKMGNVDHYFKDHPDLYSNIDWVTGDVTDIFSLKDAFAGIAEVYHCAGRVSFQPSDKLRMQHVNIEGTTNVVNFALEFGIKKLCHVSSVAALGRNGSGEVINENVSWKNSPHNSSYAISKYGAEREVWRGIAEGLSAVIVNPGIIVGPGNMKTDSSMIFGQVLKGLKFYTHGINGFVAVADVSKIMIALTESEIQSERYIVVSESKPFRDVFNIIADNFLKKRPNIYAGPLLSSMAWRINHLKYLLTGSKPVITKETASSAAGKYFYDNSKIRNALHYEFIPVADSVKQTAIALLKKYPQLLSEN